MTFPLELNMYFERNVMLAYKISGNIEAHNFWGFVWMGFWVYCLNAYKPIPNNLHHFAVTVIIIIFKSSRLKMLNWNPSYHNFSSFINVTNIKKYITLHNIEKS